MRTPPDYLQIKLKLQWDTLILGLKRGPERVEAALELIEVMRLPLRDKKKLSAWAYRRFRKFEYENLV